jgi:Family of unknown function (DUF6951)
MTEALVEAGACGFKVSVRVEKEKEGLVDGTMRLTVASACPDVMALARELNGSRPNTDFLGQLTKNAVFLEAAKHIRCADCPIPSAILKAARVEMGIALPKDVTIKFRPRPEG